MTALLMSPGIDQQERVFRASLIGLWSANEDRRPPSPDPKVWKADDWIRAVESCGLEVKKAGFKLGVKTANGAKYFSQTRMINEALGQPGNTLYRWWSGVAHHAAWAVGDWSVYEIAEDGQGVRSHTKLGQKRHLGMAADVAEVLAQAGEARAGYWGRDCVDLSDTRARVAALMRDCASQLPDD